MGMDANTTLKKGNYTVKKTSHDFVVINNKLSYEHHSHFTTKKGALRVLELIEKKILPSDNWWKEAVRRLLTDEEFAQLSPNKRNGYYNIPKAQRR